MANHNILTYDFKTQEITLFSVFSIITLQKVTLFPCANQQTTLYLIIKGIKPDQSNHKLYHEPRGKMIVTVHNKSIKQHIDTVSK